MNTVKSRESASIENIYTLDGRVPLGMAFPFGLQHVLAMFVANIAPVMIVTPYGGVAACPPERVLAMQAAALEQLRDVRVIPQTHKMIGQL